MNILEKIKNIGASFDINTAYITLTSTVSAMFTEGFTSYVYLFISSVTFYYSFKHNNKKSELDLQKTLLEIEKFSLENEKIKIDNEKVKNTEKDCKCKP